MCTCKDGEGTDGSKEAHLVDIGHEGIHHLAFEWLQDDGRVYRPELGQAAPGLE